MQLLERLQYHIQKIQEVQKPTRNPLDRKLVFIFNKTKENPGGMPVYRDLSASELQYLIKNGWDGAKGFFNQNKWYFWDASHNLLTQVSQKLNVRDPLLIIASLMGIDNTGRYLSQELLDQISRLLPKLSLEEMNTYRSQLSKALKVFQKRYDIDLTPIIKLVKKEYDRQYFQKYYQNNKKELLSKQKEYEKKRTQELTPEEKLKRQEYFKNYRTNNRDKLIMTSRQWNNAHKKKSNKPDTSLPYDPFGFYPEDDPGVQDAYDENE